MNCPNPHCYNGTLLNAIGEVAGICPTCSGFSCLKESADRDASPAPTVAAQPVGKVGEALALLSEREADAERYRWLQDRIDYFGSSDGLQYARLNFAFGPISLTPAQLDAAIDAALAEKGPRQCNSQQKKDGS